MNFIGRIICQKAIQGFEYAIKDAEELLAHFDSINANPHLRIVKY